MAVFRPHLRMTLCIGTACYRFLPDPFLLAEVDTVYMLEGSEALIFQLQELGTGKPCALKVAKTSTRGKHIEQSISALARCPESAGLTLAQSRICLTKAGYPRLIATFPELEYAVLMPWLPGRSWAGYLLAGNPGITYTAHLAMQLARAASLTLRSLEAHGFAHTDIAGSNVLILPNSQGIELLDLEGLYYPEAFAQRSSWGTPGYQHPRLGSFGQWCAEGDRFAGALLLTEMLTWWHPQVRAHAPKDAESLFRPEELQEPGTPLWAAVRTALGEICPPALELFDQAWASQTLSGCPTLDAWATCLQAKQSDDRPDTGEEHSERRCQTAP
jgi:serine/threonine protein kinase